MHVLLAQFLDRCVDEAAKRSFPEAEFQDHLRDTQTKATELLSTNRVVKEKIQQEFDRIMSLGKACAEGKANEVDKSQLEKERETLKIKTLTLSDLLAVFRSI